MYAISTITREDLHKKLVLNLDHFIKNNNWTGLAMILNNLPNGANKKRVIIWIKLFTPLRLIAEKSSEARFRISDEDFDDYNKAISTHYWDLKLSNKATPRDKNTKELLREYMSNFITDPSDTNYHLLLQNIDSYKKFGNSTAKKRMKITPAQHLQGGNPS